MGLTTDKKENKKILFGILIGATINAIINGAIQWNLLSGYDELALTVDGITNDDHTVFGTAVPLAVSLATIITLIAYVNLKKPRSPFFPDYFWLAIKHGFFTLGIMVTSAVLWQRMMGTIVVSMPVAVVILAITAATVNAIINYMTIKASLSVQ